jgi:glycerophosphoryl diester phosphodiesterase
VISGDQNVVVSHEPYFAADISSLENGKAIDAREEKHYNLYQMTYEEIAAIDVGLKAHPRFPSQKRIKAVKPLFSEVIQKAEAHAKNTGRPLPFYNVEIKRRPEWDNRYHPNAKEFARLVLDQIKKSEAGKRIYVQSFDKESLQACKILNDKIPLVLLVEDKLDFEQHIAELGFIPEVYSPYFELVDQRLVEQCKKAGIALIPWTVNQTRDMENLLDLGVDGIITDYPDRLLTLIHQKGYKVK